MMEIQDHLGRTISLKKVPERIVSLVPSQTELLADLGLEKSIVGITRFCVHPQNLRSTKTSVGGTKKVKIQKIKDLRPDIILCNKEENTREMVEELEKIAPVHVSDVATLEDAFEMMKQYGEIFNCTELSNTMISAIKKKVTQLKILVDRKAVKKVAYFIWKDPLMVAGQGTFINEMLKLNNFYNVFSESRYPETTEEEILKRYPELCLLSSEPYPFKEKHREDFGHLAGEVRIVNGEYFSWYGSRLLEALEYFKQFHS